MKQGPFPPRRLCCPPDHQYYDPLRLPLGRLPLPGITGYRQARFPDTQSGAEEGLPSSQDNLLTVPRSLRRRVPQRPLQDQERLPWPSPIQNRFGSLSTAPTKRRSALRRCKLRFMLRTGQSFHPASHPASQPRTGASLPGTLVSPRTGLTPVGCPELVVQLRHNNLLVVMAPKLLGALRDRHLCEHAAVPRMACSGGELLHPGRVGRVIVVEHGRLELESACFVLHH